MGIFFFTLLCKKLQQSTYGTNEDKKLHITHKLKKDQGGRSPYGSCTFNTN